MSLLQKAWPAKMPVLTPAGLTYVHRPDRFLPVADTMSDSESKARSAYWWPGLLLITLAGCLIAECVRAAILGCRLLSHQRAASRARHLSRHETDDADIDADGEDEPEHDDAPAFKTKGSDGESKYTPLRKVEGRGDDTEAAEFEDKGSEEVCCCESLPFQT